MKITCPNCQGVCETEQEIAIGQHVICPFCNMKFAYGEGPVVLHKVKKFNWKMFWIIIAVVWVLTSVFQLLDRRVRRYSWNPKCPKCGWHHKFVGTDREIFDIRSAPCQRCGYIMDRSFSETSAERPSRRK